MVTVDSTASPVRIKRRGKGAPHRQKLRNRLRAKSTRLVKTGQIDLAPCLVSGSEQNLTIHHAEPIQPDRVGLFCDDGHVLPHAPVFRTT